VRLDTSLSSTPFNRNRSLNPFTAIPQIPDVPLTPSSSNSEGYSDHEGACRPVLVYIRRILTSRPASPLLRHRNPRSQRYSTYHFSIQSFELDTMGIRDGCDWALSYILFSVIRFFQFVLALVVCGLYGVDLNSARKQHKYADGKWVCSITQPCSIIDIMSSELSGALDIESRS
jgi:hypothetical protein